MECWWNWAFHWLTMAWIWQEYCWYCPKLASPAEFYRQFIFSVCQTAYTLHRLKANLSRYFLFVCVVEWSGGCCMHSSLHSGKRETTAGSVQQQQDFIFEDQPAWRQRTHSQTYTVSAGRRKSKQKVQSIRSLNNQISNICVSSALFYHRFLYNHTTN